jgi:SepF-like predicted cell division protein (DUF552 family)
MSESEIVDNERAEIERRGSVDLMQLPRLLGGALNDLRTIATHITTLPSLLANLENINERVASLDDEVKQMRAAVETMGGDVVELGGGIDRVETQLEGVAHPLRRLSRRRPPNGGEQI